MIKLYLKNDKKMPEENIQKSYINSRVYIDLQEIKNSHVRNNYTSGKCKIELNEPVRLNNCFKLPVKIVAIEGIYRDFIFEVRMIQII